MAHTVFKAHISHSEAMNRFDEINLAIRTAKAVALSGILTKKERILLSEYVCDLLEESLELLMILD